MVVYEVTRFTTSLKKCADLTKPLKDSLTFRSTQSVGGNKVNKINLQFFAEGDEPEDTSFDLEAFEQEFNENWKEEDEPQTEETTDEDGESEVTDSTDTDENSDEVDEQSTEDQTDELEVEDKKKVLQTPEQNEAFKKMRLQLEEAKKKASLVDKIAEQNGISSEEVLKQYEESLIKKQAEEQKIPVDVLKRLNNQENEISQMKYQSFATSFNSQVEKVKSDNNLTDDEIFAVMDYMKDNQLNPQTIKFEDAYFLANKETFVQKQIEKTRQQELSDKKKRQQSSAIPNDGSASPTDSVGDEVLAFLKEEGHIR
jgi:hypothetical protein